jgi:hypothetical protein
MYKALPRDIYDFPFEPQAPYLILAGDIGYPFHKNYFQFLSQLSPLFEHIFLTTGNHEYYQTHFDVIQHPAKSVSEHMSAIDARIREVVAQFPNVTFLQNEGIDLSGTNLTFFGGTLWSDIDPAEEADIVDCISDYRWIPGFTPSKSRELCHATQDALAVALAAAPTRDFVVMTHHLPSYTLVADQYKTMKPAINSAFATELSLAQRPQIKAWVAGHTHTPMEVGKFHVNPFGYPREARQSGTFNRTFEV